MNLKISDRINDNPNNCKDKIFVKFLKIILLYEI